MSELEGVMKPNRCSCGSRSCSGCIKGSVESREPQASGYKLEFTQDDMVVLVKALTYSADRCWGIENDMPIHFDWEAEKALINKLEKCLTPKPDLS